MTPDQPIFWLPWMKRVLQLASLGTGLTSPNPLVGAVVLDSEMNLVGEGFHRCAGSPHAEVGALSQAGERARGGTLVVNLEPCCHFGRTPPCTEAIVKSGISKVVVALKDPDPRVSGKGIAFLEETGLKVIKGVLEDEAAFLNKEFIFRVKNGRSWGILKWAMSFDGRIGLPNGESQWISGKEARKEVHSVRSKCDAVIVGGQTVRSDDPLLTSRGISEKEPLRVVLSNSLDLPHQAQVFDTSIARSLLAFDSTSPKKLLKRISEEVELLELSPASPINLLEALSKRGCNSVLWECGPRLATEVIKQNCVQELLVVASPKLLGGANAMTPLGDFGISLISEAFSMEKPFLKRIGNDFLFRMEFPKNE